jgi:hypothetical protein
MDVVPEAFALIAAPPRYPAGSDEELPEGASNPLPLWNADYPALIAPLIGAVQQTNIELREEIALIRRELELLKQERGRAS